MTILQGSRSGLAWITESTFGITPTTPALTYLPYTSHSFDMTKDRVQGNDIQPDRMLRVDRHGNRKVAGDMVADLRKGHYDHFMESAFMSTWDTNVLKIGTAIKSFSIEDSANATPSTDAYRLFSGMSVSKLAVSVKPNSMVTGTFSFVGEDMIASTSPTGTSSQPAFMYNPWDAYSGTIKIGDSGGSLSSLATVTGVDFTIDNGFNPTFVIGSSTTPQIEYGRATVEGTITAYFEDLSLINRFINETESAFEIQTDSPETSQGMTWLFPRIKINGAAVPVAGPTSRIITLPFVALYDTTTATSIQVTRLT